MNYTEEQLLEFACNYAMLLVWQNKKKITPTPARIHLHNWKQEKGFDSSE